jgi:ABC-type transporter Mla subunit MlaD
MAQDDSLQQLLRAIRNRPEARDELRRLVLSEELLAVPERLARVEAILERLAARVDQLAEAQTRTQEQLTGLTARMDALTARMDALTARMERVEEQLSALTARVDQMEVQLLALTGRVGQLVEAVTHLAGRVERQGRELGALSELVGARAELEAEQALARLLPDKGYSLLEHLRPVAMNGEVDVAGRVRDPAGQTFSVVLEAKARLHRGDVSGWQRRLRERAVLARLGQQGLEPPFLAYAFGLRVYRDAEEAGREMGIGIITPAGEIVAPAPLTPAPRGRLPRGP